MKFRASSWSLTLVVALICIGCAKKDYQQEDFKGVWVLDMQAMEQLIKEPSTSDNDPLGRELAKAVMQNQMKDYAVEISDGHFRYLTPREEEVVAYTYTKLSRDSFSIKVNNKEIQLKLYDDTLYLSQSQNEGFLPHKRLTQTEQDAFLERHKKRMARLLNGPEPDEPASSQFMWLVNSPEKFGGYHVKNPNVIKITTEDGQNLLHYAVMFGAVTLTRHLVEVLHMDVNAQDNRGETPFYKLRLPEYQQLGDLLLANGAKIDHVTSTGTKLMYEIRQKNTEGVVYLLSKGADANGIYKNEYISGTPIDFALPTNHIPTIQVLLDYGADLSETHTKTSPVLYRAARDATIEVLDYLVSNNININAKHENFYPIQNAVYRDDDTLLPALAMFKKAGVDIDFKDHVGDTLLISAIRAESPERVKALLALGADPKAYSRFSDKSAMVLSKESGNEEIVRLMSSYGEDANSPTY